MATISFHCGSAAHRGHNIRDPKVIEKEDGHVREDGNFKIWLDVAPKDAYEKLFSKSVEDYNKTQKRNDRKIDGWQGYYQSIKKSKQQNLCYETIIGVYDNNVSTKDKREIMHEFCKTWKDRNPKLKMIGAYYHDDEANPHVHIDWIPIAQCDRGMPLQTSQNRAFEQMGYISKGKKVTNQIQWEKANRDYLKQLCEDRGIHVETDLGKKEHLDTDLYKATQKLVEMENKLDEANNELIEIKSQCSGYKKELENKVGLINQLFTTINTYRKEMKDALANPNNLYRKQLEKLNLAITVNGQKENLLDYLDKAIEADQRKALNDKMGSYTPTQKRVLEKIYKDTGLSHNDDFER